MIRKSKAFHHLDSLVDTGAASQALETKIEGGKRNDVASPTNQIMCLVVLLQFARMSVKSLTWNIVVALEDSAVNEIPTIAWDFEK